jgi:short-subunit dehydrogenase
MMNETSVKYALVTGASSGIGRHISEELARRGYSIIAVSNQPEQLETLKKELENAYAVAIIPLEINLAEPGAGKRVFNYCEKNGYNVEILVNNAGILVVGEAVQIDSSKAETILQLHMITPALMCRLFGKKMAERQKGYILNVSSISAVMPYPTISLYGPTKTFLRYFSRAFRNEIAPYNIKVTCLLPGATNTALYDMHNINISLAMRLGIMKKAQYVARAGVKALFAGRAESVPGFLNKLVIRLVPLIPDFIIIRINRRRITKKQRTTAGARY